MTRAWYQVLSLGFGYISAAIIAAVVLLSLRKSASDRALWRRVRRDLPQAGAAGVFKVMAGGGRRIAAGQEIRVPYEGTMGSSHSCDVHIPVRRVHLRSAFFWMEKDGLHMVALHRDGFEVDDVPVEPGDEAVLGDGAILRVGEAKLALRLYKTVGSDGNGPYVTSARRSKAQQGKGDGIGAPGRGEMRREKKLKHLQEEKTDKRRARGKEAEKGRR
ncbi:MAG: FHA domain-containing protein [Clostridia bacterium]|nr:FHA domain-containing protein [Clostridia bacterium]